MYSTRRVHKNVVEGGAFITIGDPYKTDKAPAPDRWTGKRLSCPVPASPFFSLFTYASEPYVGGAGRSPLDAKKKGFGSGDACKRDEFAITVRTEAFREQLRKEMKSSSKAATKTAAESEAVASATSVVVASPPRRSHHLYDIGRGRTTAFNPKLRRDTFYGGGGGGGDEEAEDTEEDGAEQEGQGRRRRHLRRPRRRLGPHRLTSDDIGDGIWKTEHAPPEFGPVSCTKAFFDSSHLKVAGPY